MPAQRPFRLSQPGQALFSALLGLERVNHLALSLRRCDSLLHPRPQSLRQQFFIVRRHGVKRRRRGYIKTHKGSRAQDTSPARPASLSRMQTPGFN
jgi:hypothetical protein